MCSINLDPEATPTQPSDNKRTNNPQQRLIEVGLLNYGDLIEQNGVIRQWPYPRENASQHSTTRAYDAIIINLHSCLTIPIFYDLVKCLCLYRRYYVGPQNLVLQNM